MCFRCFNELGGLACSADWIAMDFQWTGWFHWGVSYGVHKEPGLYSMFRYEHVLMLTKRLRKCGHCISPTVSQHFVTPVTCRQHIALHCRSAFCKPINALCYLVIVGHPEPEKKLLAFLSTFWHPCSKCTLMCFKKERVGCQVWKCPKSLRIRSKVN